MPILIGYARAWTKYTSGTLVAGVNPHLFGISGPFTGQRLELASGVTTLGREEGNTVVITDPAVSRRHARVTVVSGSATLEDAGSSGGTFVNEARLTGPTLLKIGDSIRLGGSVFNFMPGASVSPTGVTATMPSRSSRRKEVSAGEAAPSIPTPMPTPMLTDSSPGCMPDLSALEGCLPGLLRFLIILLIIVVVASVIGGVVMLIGLAGSAGGLSGAAGAGAPASGAGGAAGGGSDQAGGAGGDQPQDQQQQEQHPKKPAQGLIKILNVTAAYQPRKDYHYPLPVALVSWQNLGDDPVIEVFADVSAFDRANHVIGVQHGVRIYVGPPVRKNEKHSDDPKAEEGVPLVLDQGSQQNLDHATVTPTEVRVESQSNPGQTPTE